MSDFNIELISASALEGKASVEKIRIVIDAIKKRKIIVLETPLTHEEEMALITATMALVGKDFPGIEISSIGEGTEGLRAEIIKLLGGKPAGMSIIGPSSLVRQIKKNPGRLELFARK